MHVNSRNVKYLLTQIMHFTTRIAHLDIYSWHGTVGQHYFASEHTDLSGSKHVQIWLHSGSCFHKEERKHDVTHVEEQM